MYIRVKRSKTTYFIHCDPTETILDIKQKLHALIDQPINDQRLILVGTGDVLEDSKTLADQKCGVRSHFQKICYFSQVENDAVLALTLRKDDNQFEDVNIVRPNDFYQSRDADAGNCHETSVFSRHQQDVIQLNITVSYTMTVDMVKPSKNIPRVTPYFMLKQYLSRLFRMIVEVNSAAENIDQ
ncbi:ubiquitin-like domain-containing protein [Citrus sinensis]|nr:ubiquitin-like domain-containing protein [Citrus sinensis]